MLNFFKLSWLPLQPLALSPHHLLFCPPLQIRTSRDGSKTQVVRQYGCNTSSANEPKQQVTYQQDSFVYLNGSQQAGQSDQPDVGEPSQSLLMAKEPPTCGTGSLVGGATSTISGYTLL